MGLLRRSAAIALVLPMLGTARAAPRESADRAMQAWYGDLTDPETSIPCCGESDCGVVENRIVQGQFEAKIDGQWLSVPVDKVLHPKSNPTGQAVLCYSKSLGVMCFVPGPGT